MFYHTFFIAMMLFALWCAWRISVTDMRRRIIPDVYLFPLILISVLTYAFFPQYWAISLGDAAIGAVFGYGLAASVGFAFDYVMRRRDKNADTPIGFGDIKLLGVGGLWLGTTGLAWALVMACVSGYIWARVKKTRYIPFAPFFIAGAILALIGMRFLI